MDFLLKVVQHDGFAHGKPTTAFFEQHMSGLLASLAESHLSVPVKSADGHHVHHQPSRHAAFAALALIESSVAAHTANASRSQLWSNQGQDWRTFGSVKRLFDLHDANANESHNLGLGSLIAESTGHGRFELSFQHKSTPSVVRVVRSAVCGSTRDLVLEIDGRISKGTVAKYTNASHAVVLDVWVEDITGDNNTHVQFVLPKANYGRLGGDGNGKPAVVSPMPGKVVKLLVQDGQAVKAGETVVIIEAMKMEHVIAAPTDGYDNNVSAYLILKYLFFFSILLILRIVTLLCSEGNSVSEGMILAEVIAAK